MFSLCPHLGGGGQVQLPGGGSGPAAVGGVGQVQPGGVRSSWGGGSGPAGGVSQSSRGGGVGQVQLGGGESASCALLRVVCLLRSRRRTFLLQKRGEQSTNKLTKFKHLNFSLGRTISVNVVAVTSHSIGNSELSNTLQVTCPTQPASPHIVQQPSYKKGSVTIAFEKPSDNVPYGEDIIFYRWVTGLFVMVCKIDTTIQRLHSLFDLH